MEVVKRLGSWISFSLNTLGYATKNLIIPLGSFLAIMQLISIPGGLSSSGLRYWINFFSSIKSISSQQLSEVHQLGQSTPIHIKTQLRLTQKVDSRSYRVTRTRRGVQVGEHIETTDLIASDVGDKVLLVQRMNTRSLNTVIPNVLPSQPLELDTPVNLVGVLEPIRMDDEFYRRASIKMEVETGKSVLPFILVDYDGDEGQYYKPGRGMLLLVVPVVVLYTCIWLIFYILHISEVQSVSDVNAESTTDN
jgi:hypothetical protein